MLNFDDEDNFKDIFWPDFDATPGETPVTFKLRFTFSSAGYQTIRIEEVKTHPVLIVRAICKDIRRITDHKLFVRHMQDLLRQAGFNLRKDELTVDQTGDRILVAFLSGKPVLNFEKILRESHEDLLDYADMPL